MRKETLHLITGIVLTVWLLLHSYAEEPIRVWEIIDIGGLLGIQFLMRQKKTHLDSGYFFAPYIPLYETPEVRIDDFEYEDRELTEMIAAELNAEIDAEILADIRSNAQCPRYREILTGRWQEEGF